MADNKIQFDIDINSSKAQKDVNELKTSVRELSKAVEAHTKAQTTRTAAGKAAVASYKAEKIALSRAKEALADETREIKKSEAATKKATTAKNKLIAAGKKAEATAKRQAAATARLAASTNRAASSSRSFSSSLASAAVRLGAYFAITQLVVKGVQSWFDITVKFDAAQHELAAKLGVTTDKMEALTEQAIELGKKTLFSAVAISKMQVELVKLGKTQDEIIGMTGAIIELATVTGNDLPDAAKTLTIALNSYSKGAEDAADVSGVLAVATTKTAIIFEDYEQLFSVVGSTAEALNFKIEDLVSMFGQLRNRGLSAEKASVGLRNIFLQMADPSTKLAQAIGEPVDSIEDFYNALAKLRDENYDIGDLAGISDRRSVNALNSLIDLQDETKQLTKDLQNTDEAMAKMSEESMKKLSSQLTILSSAWDGFILSLENSEGVISWVIEKLTRAVRAMTNFKLAWKELTVGIMNFNAADMSVLVDMFSVYSKETRTLMKTINSMNSDEFAKFRANPLEQNKIIKTIMDQGGYSYEEADKLLIAIFNRKDVELEMLAEAALKKSKKKKKEKIGGTGKDADPIYGPDESAAMRRYLRALEEMYDLQDKIVEQDFKAVFGQALKEGDFEKARKALDDYLTTLKNAFITSGVGDNNTLEDILGITEKEGIGAGSKAVMALGMKPEETTLALQLLNDFYRTGVDYNNKYNNALTSNNNKTNKAQERSDRDSLQKRGQQWSDYIEGAGAIFGMMSDNQNEKNEEGFESAKKLRLAETFMNGAAGSVAIWAGSEDIYSKVAAQVLLAATTTAAIVKIRNTSFDGGGSSSSITSQISNVAPVTSGRALAEMERTNSPMKAYVVSTELQANLDDTANINHNVSL